MKRLILTAIMAAASLTGAMAQAEIRFDKTTHNFGKFTNKKPIVTCTFSFTNAGDSALVISNASASCGCTVPQYTRSAINPGEKGEVKVTYNGTGKFPGHFRKSIKIETNGKPKTTTLYIEGIMEDKR